MGWLLLNHPQDNWNNSTTLLALALLSLTVALNKSWNWEERWGEHVDVADEGRAEK